MMVKPILLFLFSLNLIGAALCIRNNDYKGARRLYTVINNADLSAGEKVVLCEIAASRAEQKDGLNVYNWYSLLRI